MLRIGGDAQRTYASAVRQRNCLASVKTHRTVVVLVVNRAEKRVFISVAADINVVAAHSNIGDLTVRSKGENARPVKVFICFSATRCDAAVCLKAAAAAGVALPGLHRRRTAPAAWRRAECKLPVSYFGLLCVDVKSNATILDVALQCLNTYAFIRMISDLF